MPVPGRPVVVPSPGHTHGHCALHLPDRDVLISGDALVTLDPYTGRRGPRIIAGAATADSGLALDVVLEITADAEAVVARLLKRAGEQGRADDTEPVIRRRLEVYAESTAPLADLYAERALLVQVDGMGEIDVVTGRIMEALASRGITGS